MAPTFDRFAPVMDRTFALRAFNSYETEINEHFWSFKVISEYSAFLARAEKRRNPSQATATVFKAAGPDARRIPRFVSEWLDARDELENWLRLSAIVSAASYFELYLGQVIRSVLMSDPLCRYGASKLLDGSVLLKADKELPYASEIEEITKGERLAWFERIFRDRPFNPDAISALESNQKDKK
ncbi:MAG TPA: hypothetical protein VEK55_06120 [Xanthobacteraceae bacterium]|nr:hypothetical protein [Xanthobacteraceae bacterium]